MGCGCKKNKSVQAVPASAVSARVALANGNVKMYDVMDASGALVASYSNPVTARAEARRANGTVVPRSSSAAPAQA